MEGSYSRSPGCYGNITYPSSNAAARAKKALERRRNARPHRNIRPYHCDGCGGWHLGTPRSSNLRDQKRRASREEYHA